MVMLVMVDDAGQDGTGRDGAERGGAGRDRTFKLDF